MIQITERFQILNSGSPFNSGARLLPFILTIPLVSFISSAIVAKHRIKHAYALLFGITFQLIGSILFFLLPDSNAIDPAEYGYQILLGFGLGVNNGILVNAVPFMVDKNLIGK